MERARGEELGSGLGVGGGRRTKDISRRRRVAVGREATYLSASNFTNRAR
jgi:hypothetical protein